MKKNWQRDYCARCGYETIVHRGRCFNGHSVSAVRPDIHIKEVRHKNKRIQEAEFIDGAGTGEAIASPLPVQRELFKEGE